jgi:Gluconate 2-dehydrogenase subunit 3
MGAASFAAVLPGCSAENLNRAADRVAGSGTPELENREPTVLSPHEYEMVTLLVDFIIPADDHSGSASDAAVPAFIDFLLEDVPSLQTRIRGGLVWLDNWAKDKHGTDFLHSSLMKQRVILDQIAFPRESHPKMVGGVKFFNLFRDITASGFFSSKMGMEDIQYIGNVARPEWNGCPTHVLRHVGVSYGSLR